MTQSGMLAAVDFQKENTSNETVTELLPRAFMTRKIKEEEDGRFLYFPLGKLSRNESIFEDAERTVFTRKFRPVLNPIIGKQLAVSTYYKNDLLAPANTRITLDLLRLFDELKINFKVNKSEITDDERNHALDAAMSEIMKSKREFLSSVSEKAIPAIQKDLRSFITQTLATNRTQSFHEHYEEMRGYLELANSVITSEDRYAWTAAALKKVIENEKRVFNLGGNERGETIEHIVKTTWISLMLARELDDFDDRDCETLSIICMGHDGGKALVPEEILYKKGRLTQLENDIMKSHVLLSYILSSNNQDDLNFESFVMALHHVKENKGLPQSYGIISDTHTSFYEYLTPGAQVKLNEIYHQTKRFYRVISIADTFEAISAARVYKKASSIGDTLSIMINSNKKEGVFYPAYLDAFVRFMIHKCLPKNLKFGLNDDILDFYCMTEPLTPAERNRFSDNYQGVIISTCSSLDAGLECVIFDPVTQTLKARMHLPPMFLLKDRYFD